MRQYGVEENFVRVCEGLYTGVEMRVLLNGEKSWFVVERGLRQGWPLSPLLFIFLMGMAEELERTQLGVKLEGCWCRTLMYTDDVLVDLVEAYLSRWKMKFNSRKSKIMVVGMREAGVSWKIVEEIVDEVEEFNCLGVWVDRKQRGNVQLEKMVKKQESGLEG